jgi:hypothetical protein
LPTLPRRPPLHIWPASGKGNTETTPPGPPGTAHPRRRRPGLRRLTRKTWRRSCSRSSKPTRADVHITNSGQCSWFEFAQAIFSLLNAIRPHHLLRRIQCPARRPAYLCLLAPSRPRLEQPRPGARAAPTCVRRGIWRLRRQAQWAAAPVILGTIQSDDTRAPAISGVRSAQNGRAPAARRAQCAPGPRRSRARGLNSPDAADRPPACHHSRPMSGRPLSPLTPTQSRGRRHVHPQPHPRAGPCGRRA